MDGMLVNTPVSKTCRVLSNTRHQITQSHLQRRSNPHEGVNGDIFLAAFDVADVVVVQIGFFGQFFLAPAHVPAVRADVFA